MPIEALMKPSKYNVWFSTPLEPGERMICNNFLVGKEHMVIHPKSSKKEYIQCFIKGEINPEQFQNVAGHFSCLQHFCESYDSEEMVIKAIDHLETIAESNDNFVEPDGGYTERLIELVFAKLKFSIGFRLRFFSEELCESMTNYGIDEEMM